MTDSLKSDNSIITEIMKGLKRFRLTKLQVLAEK